MLLLRGAASFCQIMAKEGSFLIRMDVAYICLHKLVYIKFLVLTEPLAMPLLLPFLLYEGQNC